MATRTPPDPTSATFATDQLFNSLPRGCVLFDRQTQAVSTNTGGDALIFGSQTFTAQANRNYKLSAYIADLLLLGGAVDSSIVVRLYVNGQIVSNRSVTIGTVSERRGVPTLVRRYSQSSTGTATVFVQMQMIGAARGQCEAGSELYGEDIGPVFS